MDLNKVMLIGRLTRDPESKTTPQGVTVASFSVATNRVWKDQQGNQQDKTEFHNIVAWRKLAEICAQYLKKGRQVYIEGHLQTRSWEGQDGKKNYRTEVVADNMIMLGSKNDSAPARTSAASGMNITTSAPEQVAVPAGPVTDEEIRIEDIPF
jgi:single-strand DNA-binding protein